MREIAIVHLVVVDIMDVHFIGVLVQKIVQVALDVQHIKSVCVQEGVEDVLLAVQLNLAHVVKQQFVATDHIALIVYQVIATIVENVLNQDMQLSALSVQIVYVQVVVRGMIMPVLVQVVDAKIQ